MTIQNYLINICQHCGLETDSFEVQVEETEAEIVASISLPEEESGLLIGFHGETLSSIQRLTRVVFQEELGEKRLVLNVNNYRQQREEKLKELAYKGAQRVIETGQPYVLSRLPANERFIIHTTLAENPDLAEVESVSEGEGRDRVLVIRLKQSE